MANALGPYRLEAPLGRGGMATVWRATHEPSGLPVAVKLLNTRQSRDRVAAFRKEARAVARLVHPALVPILDVGVARDGGPDGARPGSPFLVLELVEGGTLADHTPTLDWFGVRAVLVRVLAGLGHAHARGIVHRDVKPSNVLGGPKPETMRLADFGIAVSLADADPHRVSGTPAYMAPEQFGLDGEPIGPWTDIYAVGTMCWRLVTGDTPFDVGNAVAAAIAHRTRPLPPFTPRMPVPADLAGWLHVALAKSTERRFRATVEALGGLLSLGLPEGPAATPRGLVKDGATAPTFVPETFHDADPTPSLDVDVDDLVVRTRELDSGAGASALAVPTEAPERRPPRAWPLLRVGLPLMPHREVPPVGHGRARERMWEALVAVDRDTRVGAVVVHGASGLGVEAVARWLAEEAHLQAGAYTVRLNASSDAALLLARGLANGVALPAGTPDPAELDAGDPASVAKVVVAAAGRRAVGRLVVLVIERGGSDALLARAVVTSIGAPLRLLWVVTDVDDGSSAGAGIEVLTGDERVVDVRLGPVRASDLEAAASALVPLDTELRAALVARAAGYPDRLVDSLRDLVVRDALEPGRGGWRLRTGETLPAHDAPGPWRNRVEDFLVGRAEADAITVELAGLLGPAVVPRTWQHAAVLAGGTPPDDLYDDLLDVRLISIDEGGTLSLAHGALADALAGRAEAAGRARRLHAACAEAVPDSGRRGRHLIAAGELEEALVPLREGAEEALRRGAAGDALALLRDHREAREAAEVSELGEEAVRATLVEVVASFNASRPHDAARLGEVALERARALGDIGMLSRAAAAFAMTRAPIGKAAEGLAVLAEVLPMVRAHGDPDSLGELAVETAHALMEQGDPLAARDAVRDLPVDALRDGLRWQVFEARARAALLVGDAAAALDDAQRLTRFAADTGRENVEGVGRILIAEAAMRLGDLPAAEEAARAATERFRATATPLAVVAELVLCRVLIAGWHATEAIGRLRALAAEAKESGSPAHELQAYALVAAAAAREGDIVALRDAVERVQERWAQVDRPDLDTVDALGIAAAHTPPGPLADRIRALQSRIRAVRDGTDGR